jgi:low affinity Fe/Cu permease
MSNHLENFTHRSAKWTGSAKEFIFAILSVCAWGLAGEYFSFSQRWESGLVIYMGVITYLMIFILQRSQNKEMLALQIKLNEIIVATKRADNKLVNLEEKSEDQMSEAQDLHRQIASQHEAIRPPSPHEGASF